MWYNTYNFYPRPPRGGRPAADWFRGNCYLISIHALREEGDHRPSFHDRSRAGFLSTPSARRATTAAEQPAETTVFLSTPSARRATCAQVSGAIDTQVFLSTPSARRATEEHSECAQAALFLSTPSARRATFSGSVIYWSCINFYPRPPRGGRLVPLKLGIAGAIYFYPRPPRGGRLIILFVSVIQL